MEFVQFDYIPIVSESSDNKSWKITATWKYKESPSTHHIGTLGVSEATIENVLKAINNTMQVVIELTQTLKRVPND